MKTLRLSALKTNSRLLKQMTSWRLPLVYGREECSELHWATSEKDEKTFWPINGPTTKPLMKTLMLLAVSRPRPRLEEAEPR